MGDEVQWHADALAAAGRAQSRTDELVATFRSIVELRRVRNAEDRRRPQSSRAIPDRWHTLQVVAAPARGDGRFSRSSGCYWLVPPSAPRSSESNRIVGCPETKRDRWLDVARSTTQCWSGRCTDRSTAYSDFPSPEVGPIRRPDIRTWLDIRTRWVKGWGKVPGIPSD